MSECVVRMEMPKKCYQCNIRLRCSPFFTKAGQTKPMCEGCRIICQLPEGHGRLVDADALKDYLVAEAASYDLTQGQIGILSEAIDMIDEQPTIVPAERSEYDGR